MLESFFLRIGSSVCGLQFNQGAPHCRDYDVRGAAASVRDEGVLAPVRVLRLGAAPGRFAGLLRVTHFLVPRRRLRR